MNVGARLSYSGTARGERKPAVKQVGKSYVTSTQMLLAGPGHFVQYRQTCLLGRPGQQFVKVAQRNDYSSRNGRRGGLTTVNDAIPSFARKCEARRFLVSAYVDF